MLKNPHTIRKEQGTKFPVLWSGLHGTAVIGSRYCGVPARNLVNLINQSFMHFKSGVVFKVSKGIVKIGALVTEKNQFIFQCNQSRVTFSPKDIALYRSV